MAEHTPGPWKVGRWRATEVLALVDSPDIVVIADTEFFGMQATDRQIADARLMAAAPDLLAALEAFIEWADGHAGDAGDEIMCGECRVVTLALAAIRNARGEAADVQG